ncbi:hypothetical protein PFICI_00807 [Pestalotiopsis fici W106-1]|uniref:Zn(2)-C6 fungal-type domain-containing protein n=1 Tax=Pestalotiopsis fici (strain W106-1 / CGMCC3.15140) TaxID=1229662 RepID=W3XLV5_PESFW|nr:uncharacterized protein PFICI_00807 [Pestalotiopsis fici W106-1]ETS86979.1 hypothetical protein PFICI_00807 [Pestalotiopsis fici W106-1]
MAPRARSSAACDTCRLRKTKCVLRPGEERCILCAFHELECVFDPDGPRRKRQRRRRSTQDGAGLVEQQQDTSHTGTGQHVQQRRHHQETLAEPAASSRETYVDLSSPESSRDRISTPPAAAYPSILNETLGLDPANHAEYVGPSDYRDPLLLDLRLNTENSSSFVRRTDNRTLFIVHSDEAAASDARRIADVDAIEAVVHPHGPNLVNLYFRFVHPSFPILHKDVFIAKHRVSYRYFTPSLLAAVYLLSIEWRLHDSVLASSDIRTGPDVTALEQLADAAIQEDMRTPKLSTLEAGLLLLQRHKLQLVERPVASIWRLHSQIVAISHELGLHADCSSWSTPDWEVGLRRRIAWALYMQDRWISFVHGRPALLHDDDWDVQPCSSSDFPEYHDKPDDSSIGTIAAPTGWRLFLRQIELSQILCEIYRIYYATSATRRNGSLDQMGVRAAVDLAKPIIARLSQWKSALSPDLAFTASKPRTLCASASLHLAYHTVVIAMYRALVRILTPDTPESLYTAVRSAARDKLQAAVQLLGSMQPEHTSAFWGSVASYQVAMIGAFAGLLWATAETSEEIAWCAARIDDLKWALRVRGAAAPFAREALQLLEHETSGLNALKAT